MPRIGKRQNWGGNPSHFIWIPVLEPDILKNNIRPPMMLKSDFVAILWD